LGSTGSTRSLLLAPVRGVIDYLRRVDPEYGAQAELILRETPAIAGSVPATVIARIKSLRNRLHEKQAEYLLRGGKQAWAVAERHANVIL
jgi:hypothetical protein